MPKPKSRISATLPLTDPPPGRATGDLCLRWSDNTVPLGVHPVPVITLTGGPGPVVLILGGVHGDEFEGPVAIMRLAETLDPATLAGRLILVPFANAPAAAVSARCSPLDGGNLNRAFPGDPGGGPTAMLADYYETVLIPLADAVVDLHSGGKASVFAPSALATLTGDAALTAANLALAEAMGLPTVWRLGAFNDDRSVNSAAARASVPMIAAELGGGGGADPGLAGRAEAGLLRVLAHLGLIGKAPPPPEDANQRHVEMAGLGDVLTAPARGLFDRHVSAGEPVTGGRTVGVLRFPEEPARPPAPIRAPVSGFVLAHTNRGLVARGDLLVQIARVVAGG